jgi:hypothetical protein
MAPKSNNDKKKEALAAGKAPKLTKQQENAGKSSKQKAAETKVSGKALSEAQPSHSSTGHDAFLSADCPGAAADVTDCRIWAVEARMRLAFFKRLFQNTAR